MLGQACALGAALTWSISVILFKRSEAASPQAMNLFKNVASLTLLLLTLPIMGQAVDWQRPAEEWVLLLLSGALGIAVADTLVFMALRRLGAGLLAVVDCVYSPVIITFGVVILGEQIGQTFVIGGVLVVGGVLVATTGGRPLAAGQGERETESAAEAASRRERLVGVLLGIVGIVVMALSVVIAKPLLERGSLVEVTTIRLVGGVAGQLLWIALVPGQRSTLRVFIPSANWRTLLPASVLGSYVAMLLWLGGFKWATASTASVLNQMSTVFTMLLAAIVLREPLTARRGVGAAGAMAGALLVLFR
jgi:drug/metabolite transporter (DMT)-like permease